jgi:hypothetical protein
MQNQSSGMIDHTVILGKWIDPSSFATAAT